MMEDKLKVIMAVDEDGILIIIKRLNEEMVQEKVSQEIDCCLDAAVFADKYDLMAGVYEAEIGMFWHQNDHSDIASGELLFSNVKQMMFSARGCGRREII